MADELEHALGHRPEMHRFSETYFKALKPNEPMIELMRELKADGYRMALLTNNVREWEPTWRSMLPVDEIFELVVDSAFVGCRKPEPQIYEITLERLGLPGSACLFIDDVNVQLRRGPGARADRGPLPRQRAGDPRDPRCARQLSGGKLAAMPGANVDVRSFS